MEKNSQNNEWLKDLKDPITGGIAGFCTRALTQPLDCLKIRHQLQVEPIKMIYGSKYTSMLQTVKMIFKEERIRGFWKGHIPGQVQSIIFGFGRVLLYDTSNQYLKHFEFFNNHSKTRHFVAGGFSGTILLLIVTPFDVVRTRFIAQDTDKGYNSLRGALRAITQKEGLRGLYRGLTPSIVALTPNAAIQFGVYNVLLEHHKKYTEEEPSKHFLLSDGILCAVIAKMLSSPLDLIKKRLQIQRFHENRTVFGKNVLYSGIFDCMRQTYRDEGLTGFYKGLPFALVKTATVRGVFLFFFEEISSELNKFEIL